ncbi:QacE family quaternary ammonium compound efflux SMR transporter [Tianweitania sp. BSSL-BM11]|uniref:QacE family quaternary ammonium compound efflux SMR transporter n=1 Tax=Tianweitania aestuarii TaxID=2814886 RepID=A0ABS5RTD9_9HYPH|nr:SMR family transporter [Tianweitania aestuarii]MBS9720315.1 QacE family quaternary ammonium compound efflux SMR transporter [Tianweitania aestuarii]
MQPYVILVLAIAAEVIGTSALKASQGFTRVGPSLVVALAYGAAFYLLARVFSTIPVGIAYAIWSAGGIILVTLVAWALYNQRPDGFAVLGMSLIIAGVLVINLLSKTSTH